MSTMRATGDEPAVLTEIRAGVGVIALNRPDRFNALLLQQIETILP